jgi:cation:H+ antiporter
MRLIFQFQKRNEPSNSDREYAHISKGRAFVIYSLNAAIVIAAATWLPQLGERIAEQTGLGQSFVGSLFIALSTSLPEFVVTYTALRRGAVNLALGNVLGSNLFNVAILAIDDVAYTSGPLLAQVGSEHLVTAAGAVLMTALALVGLTYRSQSKHLGFGWDSVAIIVVFAAATWTSHLVGGAG